MASYNISTKKIELDEADLQIIKSHLNQSVDFMSRGFHLLIGICNHCGLSSIELHDAISKRKESLGVDVDGGK